MGVPSKDESIAVASYLAAASEVSIDQDDFAESAVGQVS